MKKENHSEEQEGQEIEAQSETPSAKGGSASGGKDDAFEQVLRLRADFENTKKRLERDKLDSIKYANERLLAEILPIVDNLERAVKSLTEGHDPEMVKKGLGLANDELHKVLERHGVQVVKTKGAEFDPNLHEAVAMVETDDVPEGKVIDEMQKGYVLNGRLIRPARVRIAQKKN